jgi:hypothetical protein
VAAPGTKQRLRQFGTGRSYAPVLNRLHYIPHWTWCHSQSTPSPSRLHHRPPLRLSTPPDPRRLHAVVPPPQALHDACRHPRIIYQPAAACAPSCLIPALYRRLERLLSWPLRAPPPHLVPVSVRRHGPTFTPRPLTAGLCARRAAAGHHARPPPPCPSAAGLHRPPHPPHPRRSPRPSACC